MIKFQYLIQRSTHDNRLSLTIVRDSKQVKLDLLVKPVADSLFLHLSQVPVPYFVFGPLVFSEASSEYALYMTAYGNSSKDAGSTSGYGLLSLLYTGNPLFTRYGDRPGTFPDERIVVIAFPAFTHKIGKGYNIYTPPQSLKLTASASATSRTWSR